MGDEELRERALALHRELQGKIEISCKGELDAETLDLLYTPGVGYVCEAIAEDESQARELTMKRHAVAVVSDGTAVLGLGDIGPKAALPVMEGKALLFKELAGIDAFPIVVDAPDADALVAAVRAIAPTFGGINLEDIASPRCFEVEHRLEQELDIPVFHDDQHATAIAALAGLINAFKVVGKELESAAVVVIGAGAAGAAILKLLKAYGVANLAITDSDGVIASERDDLDEVKRELAEVSGAERGGSVEDALRGADVVVAVSVAGALGRAHVESMADDAVVFALANPDPEIDPEEARDGGAAVVATGRSDYPNQVNNVLVFPGLFRGALDAGVESITDEVKIAAAEAIADLVEEPTADEILPSPFAGDVVDAVADAVAGARR